MHQSFKLRNKCDYRYFCTAVLGFLAYTAIACSPESSSTGKKDFKVALLTAGANGDKSWNRGAYDDLIQIRDSLGAKVSHIETRTPADFDENFRQYGSQGYSPVFGRGFEFQDAARRITPKFPKTIYITTSGTTSGTTSDTTSDTTSGTDTTRNVAGIEFAFEEASYLAGMMAGAITHTGVISMIGGTELPSVRRSFAAFALGARATNPSVKTLISYISNWDNVSAGKEQAFAQIGQHADIIFQNADAAGLGVFQATRESKDVRVIGSSTNQNNVAPDVTIGSVVIDLPQAFLAVAREIKSGRFPPRVISLGLHDSIVRLVLNPRLESTISVHVRSQIDSARIALDRKATTKHP